MTTKTETPTESRRSFTTCDRHNVYTPALFSGLELVRDSVRTLPKTATGHGYRYTPLDEILDYIRPILKKAELVMFQQTDHDDEGRVGVTTVILANDGGHLSSTVFAPEPYRNRTTTVETASAKTTTTEKDVSQMSAIQRAGCEITYLRRYSLASVLGLASDEDKDGYSYNATSAEDRRKTRIAKLTAALNLTNREDKEAEIAALESMTDEQLVSLWKELNG